VAAHSKMSSHALSAAALLFGMFLMLELGRRIGLKRRILDPESVTAGLTAMETAVFGLMGLLIAFTFSGAALRFDNRRSLIAEETNTIGTAYLRLSLLKPAAQARLREHFRHYVDVRLSFFQSLSDVKAASLEMNRTSALQDQIWSEAVAACSELETPAPTMLVLPALNAMIDITTTRYMALLTHPPAVIHVMLGIIALVSSLLAGYQMGTMRTRSWIHVLSFTVLIAVSIYIILDLEYPRAGLIRVDAADQVLIDLREKMK
jgi:hypothetical protein